MELYEERKLLPGGGDVPLYDICTYADRCWDGEDRPAPENAGICVPWVGSAYESGGICVVGMNFHNYGGLAGHWRVCRDHVESMLAGRQGKNNEFFATGATSYARALELSASGELPETWTSPSRQELATVWSRCAYLQAIKCAPSGPRSRPSDEMCAKCPPFLLTAELEILRPAMVVLLGRDALRDVVRPLLNVRWGESPGHFERDYFTLADGTPAELFCCNHPSGSNRHHWEMSLQQMVDSLRAHRVGEGSPAL